MALTVPICVLGQAATAHTLPRQGTARFVGVWRGEFDGLPGVDMVISDEGDRAAGGILFYLHVRPDTRSPYTSRPGLPEPMQNIRLGADQALHFEVSHRRAHPPGTLHDAPMKFSLKFTAPDRAELVNESEGAPMVVMIRSDY
jgi:hypothetical protein